MAPTSMIAATIVFGLALLFSGCHAGDYCYSNTGIYTTYCLYGCCGPRNTECCSSSVGLIVGLCVGGAVFLFFIILTICLCRRRRYAGVVYNNQPAVVVQQSNMMNHQGIVNTAGVQPGVIYPPYQQYPYPGTNYPAVPASPPAYPAQPSYVPQPYASEPPRYDTLNHNAYGGVTNRGFDEKN